jgi:hypothetical protein
MNPNLPSVLHGAATAVSMMTERIESRVSGDAEIRQEHRQKVMTIVVKLAACVEDLTNLADEMNRG